MAVALDRSTCFVFPSLSFSRSNLLFFIAYLYGHGPLLGITEIHVQPFLLFIRQQYHHMIFTCSHHNFQHNLQTADDETKKETEKGKT